MQKSRLQTLQVLTRPHPRAQVQESKMLQKSPGHVNSAELETETNAKKDLMVLSATGVEEESMTYSQIVKSIIVHKHLCTQNHGKKQAHLEDPLWKESDTGRPSTPHAGLEWIGKAKAGRTREEITGSFSSCYPFSRGAYISSVDIFGANG